MAPGTRRSEALSRERIVAAAVELLDAAGEDGLTFKALTGRLVTGPGAIYWHVANKDELLTAATDAVVGAALAAEPPDGSARDGIRAVALAVFEAIDAHPWVAARLSASAWTATPALFESIGQQVRVLGVPQDEWFTVTSVLLQYVLGAAAQNAANARAVGPDVDRDAFLRTVSTRWEGLDPDAFGFTRAVAGQMRDHDDREQFLAGVDLLLAGVGATHGSGPRPR